MAENKTQPTAADVHAFIDGVENEQRRDDAREVLEMMSEVSGYEPTMWGPSIVGFGKYHYKYESGREGDFMRIGFSPRKNALTLYIMPGFERFDDLMGRLGKFKTGKSCLYVKNLDDVDRDVLRELVEESLDHMKKWYPDGA